MGYRSDVALVFSKVGWEKLTELLDGQHTAFSVEECESVIDLLNCADDHSIDSSSGDNLLVWYSIKSSATNADLLFDRACNLIDDEQWYRLDLGEDGATEYGGSYCDNPFDICVSHNLNTSEGDISLSGKKCSIKPPVKYIELTVMEVSPWPLSATPPVDNYTCSCGNSKLNDVSDKSCWKCGAPVK